MAKQSAKNNQPAASGNGGQGSTESAQAGNSNENENELNDQSIVGLEVSSMTDGYRRCGRAWTRHPQVVPADDFSEEELLILRNDPGLRVFAVRMPAADEAE